MERHRLVQKMIDICDDEITNHTLEYNEIAKHEADNAIKNVNFIQDFLREIGFSDDDIKKLTKS